MREILDNFTEYDSSRRLRAMMTIVISLIILFMIRLFFLQVVNGDEYRAQADEQHFGKVVIPAKRGEILSENPKTGEINKLATNITLDLVYIDPESIPDKPRVAKALAPILFDAEENKPHIIKDTRTKEELTLAYEQEILKKISTEYSDYVPLAYGIDDTVMNAVDQLKIPGIYVIPNKNLIYANPTQVPQKTISSYAKSLSGLIKVDEKTIISYLTKRKVRYVPLKRKLSPEQSDAIWTLKEASYKAFKKDQKNIPHYFKGVVLVPEHWRYYPEKEVGSTVVGYTDNEGIGRYGIEEKFQNTLKGENGVFFSQKDEGGRQFIFDNSKMMTATDGDSVVLTIDRALEEQVLNSLKKGVEKYHADSASAVIMDPLTGKILAMENYPNFDPNEFGKVYELRATEEWEWNGGDFKNNKIIYPTQPVFIKDEKGNFKQVNYDWLVEERRTIAQIKERVMRGEKNKLPDGTYEEITVPKPVTKYVYKNRFGLSAYVNKSITGLYEPGSVFKPLVMSIGIDAGEVTPNTTYNESGKIEIDTGTGQKQYIHTALNVYRGIQTMTNALEHSSNIGMAFVARKLGKSLFHKYITDFGFGDYTYIDLAGEEKGEVVYWKQWSEARLLTTSFGQGVSITPLQMATAWSALANGGVLMQPQIVKTIIHQDGTRENIEPKIVRRVISEQTSKTITAMLVSTVENGAAGRGKVTGYRSTGKTGTAQIACPDSHRCTIGEYESGEGTVITSYGGYAPVHSPRFVMIVKVERPRLGFNTWGENTAAPIFKEVADFMYKYYDIPPDDL